jgi:hypothetical protein
MTYPLRWIQTYDYKLLKPLKASETFYVCKLEGYLLTVHPVKPHFASVFKDRWRIMAEGRNRGGLPLMHDYGDFAVLMVA